MHDKNSWLQMLDAEDLVFLKRFVLASGSLKDLGAIYGVSYPTIRLRLDRLIAKIEVFDNQTAVDDFERLVRGLHIDGKLDHATLKLLLAAHASTAKEQNNASSSDVVYDVPAGPAQTRGGG